MKANIIPIRRNWHINFLDWFVMIAMAMIVFFVGIQLHLNINVVSVIWLISIILTTLQNNSISKNNRVGYNSINERSGKQRLSERVARYAGLGFVLGSSASLILLTANEWIGTFVEFSL